MGTYLPVFLIALLLLAVFLREDFVLTLVYLLVGSYLSARWWVLTSMRYLSVERRLLTQRIFLGERLRVRLEITNRGWLPLPWLQLHESLPVELTSAHTFRQVVSLGPKGKAQFEYWLEGRKRGYYEVGPLSLYSGDVLGVIDQIQRSYEPLAVTVYPRIIPFNTVRIPSNSPQGTLRHTQPIFEDPNRPIGKRDYTSGDSMRRVDWKSSAVSGRLQVKTFEPSIALDTCLFLDLNSKDYPIRRLYDLSELAIVVAASLAYWITNRKQSVGLATNGVDPLHERSCPPLLPVRRGRAHLMRLLEVLARIDTAETAPLVELIQHERVALPWGTTLLVITGKADDELFEALFLARRSGLDASLILMGQLPGLREIQARARYFGFPLMSIQRESDLDIWRR